MLSLSEVVNWLKAFWPRLANLKEENTTEAMKEVDQTMEIEDQGLMNKNNEEEKAREIEDVVKDRGADGADESLKVLESLSTDEQNRCTGEENDAMEEGEVKEDGEEKSVEDMTEKEDAHEEEQERNRKKAINQEVEKVFSSSNRGEEELMEKLKVDQIRRKHNIDAEDKQESHDQDEGKEPDAKKRKVIKGDKKLPKKQWKKAKREKRRQRRGKQSRSSFLSTQGNLDDLQSGRITEQETAVAIKELKSEVLVIGQTTSEINKKLQISLLNQVLS